MTIRFGVRSRILHWLTAVLVFTGLIIGFVMVNSLDSYAALIAVHTTIGISVLAITLVRVVNRIRSTPPAWPATVGPVEGKVIGTLERLLYALLLLQPLVGWAMISATGAHVVVFGGLELPRIAPFDDTVYFVLRQTHSVLAYVLVAVIAAHVSIVLAHTVALRDRMLSRMSFGSTR